MKDLIIQNATHGNLKQLSLTIPKQQMVVLCGVSGSGKSTLAVDVIFNECQRLYLEALGMQGIVKPKVERILSASVAILISHNDKNQQNPRSYVGTYTDIYTDLRMLYEKLGTYPCPHCHKLITPYLCVEEVIKETNTFHVLQTCTHCHKQMDKLTRSHFSYNTKEGACPKCHGFGETLTINWKAVLDETKSLQENYTNLWLHKYKDYQTTVFMQSMKWYGLSVDITMPIKDLDVHAKHILMYGTDDVQVKNFFPTNHPPKTVKEGRFEGIAPFLYRKAEEKGMEHTQVRTYFMKDICPECLGERLNKNSCHVSIQDMRLPQLSRFSLDSLLDWTQALKTSISEEASAHVNVYLEDIITKCLRLQRVGLSYLSLDRRMSSLSGGEIQRLKLAASIDCELEGLLYILDEPTIGLHPKDTQGLLNLLYELKNKGNSVLIIEHDPMFLEQVDHIIEIGPQAGIHGGEVIFEGTYKQLLTSTTPTANWLNKTTTLRTPRILDTTHTIHVQDVTLHNLNHLSVEIKTHGFLCVTGVSGSGKSTLVFDVIAKGLKQVQGLTYFDSIQEINQSTLHRSTRSNVATYSGVYTHIRSCFASQSKAKAQGIDLKAFSFNSEGGRCPHCEGLGYVVSNRLFFADAQVTCPNCLGKQFQKHVLNILYKGYSISDILDMEIQHAITIFENKKLLHILQILIDCGLGYIRLGQSLTTLSQGEAQRLKLAKELSLQTTNNTLYLFDEPTIGLHPQDIAHFLTLIQRLVDQGNTVLMVEHNVQVIQACDYIIDMGIGGGIYGGNIIAQGTVEEMRQNKNSITGAYL